MRSPRNLPVLAVAAAPLPAPGPVIPQQFANPGLSLLQIAAIVRAYWKHTTAVALVFVVITAIWAKMMPKTYTATSTMMVNYQSNDPLAGAQGLTAPLGNYMSTEIQLMGSAEVLLPVIQKLKLTENPEYVAGYHGDGSTLADWVREILVKDLVIEPGQAGSQLIFVTASARTPQMAAAIANTLSDIYLGQERDRVSGPASERAKRYAQELAELKDKVRIAQDQVTAFRQRTGVTDAAEKSTNVQADLLASLETRLQEAQNARRIAEVKSSGDANFSSGTNGPSNPVQTLKAQIEAQEAQLAQMGATLGAQHPKVLELKSQISATKANLAAELRNVSAGSSSDLTGARELEAKLRVAVDEQRAKVLGISKLQDEGTKFVLELESAQSVYKRALDGYDQIMFASGSHMANISMVSRAVPPQKVSKPNKIKLLLFGAIAGLFFGLVGPFGYELFINRRVRCRDDYEREFGLPILMEFDTIMTQTGAT